MSARLLTSFLTAVLTASALCAQGLELPPPPKPPEQPAKQDQGGAKTPPTEAGQEGVADAAAKPGYWADPQSPAEEIFLAFETVGRDTEVVHKRTLNELRSLGLRTKPAALKALGSPFSPSVVLGAELLEWVGGAEDAEALVAAASSTPDTAAVNACLSCAMRLGNGHLPANAVTLLDHPRRQVRTLAEARLQEKPSQDYLPKLLQFLNYGRDSDLKLRAARLLSAYPGQEDVRDGLRGTLAGDSVEVAMVAIHALQGQGGEDDISYMEKELLVAKTTQEAGYLAFGLVQLQDQRPELVLNPGLESRLRFLLDDQDLFVSGTAAAALAELAFRTDLVGSQAELDRKLPLYLVRAVGGVIFYPQYSYFAPLAERSLRRITGEDFGGEDGSAWIRWMQENQEGFQLVRGQLDLNDESLPRLRLAWAAGEGLAQVFVGPKAAWSYGDRVLGPSDLALLQAALVKSRLLEASVLPGTYGLATSALSASFDIKLGTQRKMMRYRGRAGDSTYQPMLAVLQDLESKTAWQSLASRDEMGHQFVLDHLQEFDQMAPGTARQGVLLALMRERLDTLDEQALRNWVRELQEMSDLDGLWSEELALDFLGLAAREAPQDTTFATQLLDLALTVPSAKLLSPTVEAILALDSDLQQPLLLAALQRFSPSDLAMLLGDPRLKLREAAVNVLAMADPTQAAPLLRTALADPEQSVVRQALRSLGTLAVADEDTFQALQAFAAPGQDSELRGEAMWGLGRLGNSQAVPLLLEASREQEMPIQVAAIEALGHLGGQEADDALRALFPEYADSVLESSYLRAIMSAGAGRARAILRPHLLSEDPLVSNRAALLAGSLGDPASAPSLMAMLQGAPRDAELLQALATTVCVDFRRLPDPAGTYLAWWEEHRKQPPSLWLQKPAADAGYPLEAAFLDPEAVPTRESAKVLLDLLMQGPTWMRPAAAYYLETLSGKDALVILASTPKAEVAYRARVWREWLAK